MKKMDFLTGNGLAQIFIEFLYEADLKRGNFN